MFSFTVAVTLGLQKEGGKMTTIYKTKQIEPQFSNQGNGHFSWRECGVQIQRWWKSFTKVCRLWLVSGLLFTQQKKVLKPQESLEKTSWEGHSNQHDWSGQENRRTELDMLSHPLTSARPSNPNPDFLNQYHSKKSSTKVRVTLWSQDFQWKWERNSIITVTAPALGGGTLDIIAGLWCHQHISSI